MLSTWRCPTYTYWRKNPRERENCQEPKFQKEIKRAELVTVNDVHGHFERSQVFEIHIISLQPSTHQIAEMSRLKGNLAIT